MCMKSAAAALKYFLSRSHRETAVLRGNVVRFAIDVDNLTFFLFEVKKKKHLTKRKKKTSNKKKTRDFFLCLTDC